MLQLYIYLPPVFHFFLPLLTDCIHLLFENFTRFDDLGLFVIEER